MKKVTTLLIVYFFKILEIESVPVVDWCNITGNASGFVRGEKVFRLQLPDKDVENLVQCYCKIELYGIWWPSPYIYLENFEKLTNNCQRQRKILVNGMYQQHPCGEQGHIDIYNNVRYNSITVGVEEIPRISNTSGYITIKLSKLKTNTVTCGYIINQTSTVQPTTKLKWRLFTSSPITTKIQATRLSRFTTNPTTPTSMKRLETEPSSYSSSKTTNKLTNPNTSKTGISTLVTLKNSLKTTVRSTSSTIPVVSSKKNRNTGIIAGVITGIIVLAVVVIVGMIVVCRRKGRCKFPKPNDENQPTYHPWRPSVDSNCSTDTMNTCISWSANDNQEQPTYEIIPGDNPSYTQEDTTDAYQPWGNGTDNVIAGIEAKLQHTEKSNEDDHEMQGRAIEQKTGVKEQDQ
ncbi:uncharacterized protein LOC141900588 isoform X2 [Tubulanus polymorphus]|uniref:uncharacterized protein LOC141900588 isoform X2 n=1 Tax=Tubulanus polymorphus TaxID=672921 RepID=UPI003DA3DDCB